jgi:CRP-like cAMP-binding protein
MCEVIVIQNEPEDQSVLRHGITVTPETLQKYSLFGGLLIEQIAGILSFMEQKTFQAGEAVISEGKNNDRVYFILEGKVEISKDKVVLAEMGEGDAFGEMEIIEVMPTAATITALTRVSIISLSNKNLHKIYKSDIGAFAMIIMNLARDISRRLRRMDKKAAGEDAE